jgi:hypothetical protein
MKCDLNLTYTQPQVEIFERKEKFITIPKGRRFGATKGAANYYIESAIDGVSPMLWVDTINGNIERYFERYFEPVLRSSCVPYKFNVMKHQLTLTGSIIDFRSADKPESIEGFGYKKIFMNEAGITLKDNYLYTNAVLPMLMDYQDSQMYAIGTPKGKKKRNGEEHLFYSLVKRALAGEKDFYTKTYTSYQNPLLRREDIESLEKEMAAMDSYMVRQEIYGEFIDVSGDNPFAHAFDEEKHITKSFIINPTLGQLYLSIDFNLTPFGALIASMWRDEQGLHCHVIDEIQIEHGSLPKMIDEIKNRCGNRLRGIMITGDAMGKRGDIGRRDNASLYDQLRKGLGLSWSQVVVPGNPTHENSRADVNYILTHFPDFKVHDKCLQTIYDMRYVQCDAFGSIIKKDRTNLAQHADLLDCVRYLINAFLKKWILSNRVK